MTKYIHIHTGSIDTREGWIASYATEELDERGITAEQAFDEDEGVTLIEQPPEYKPSTFRIRVDLDREVSILAATIGRTKQDLMEEATKDLLKKYSGEKAGE